MVTTVVAAGTAKSSAIGILSAHKRGQQCTITVLVWMHS